MSMNHGVLGVPWGDFLYIDIVALEALNVSHIM